MLDGEVLKFPSNDFAMIKSGNDKGPICVTHHGAISQANHDQDLIFVKSNLAMFTQQVHILLFYHNGSLHLKSLPQCYYAKFNKPYEPFPFKYGTGQDLEKTNLYDGYVLLEHLLSYWRGD